MRDLACEYATGMCQDPAFIGWRKSHPPEPQLSADRQKEHQPQRPRFGHRLRRALRVVRRGVLSCPIIGHSSQAPSMRSFRNLKERLKIHCGTRLVQFVHLRAAEKEPLTSGQRLSWFICWFGTRGRTEKIHPPVLRTHAKAASLRPTSGRVADFICCPPR